MNKIFPKLTNALDSLEKALDDKPALKKDIQAINGELRQLSVSFDPFAINKEKAIPSGDKIGDFILKKPTGKDENQKEQPLESKNKGDYELKKQIERLQKDSTTLGAFKKLVNEDDDKTVVKVIGELEKKVDIYRELGYTGETLIEVLEDIQETLMQSRLRRPSDRWQRKTAATGKRKDHQQIGSKRRVEADISKEGMLALGIEKLVKELQAPHGGSSRITPRLNTRLAIQSAA